MHVIVFMQSSYIEYLRLHYTKHITNGKRAYYCTRELLQYHTTHNLSVTLAVMIKSIGVLKFPTPLQSRKTSRGMTKTEAKKGGKEE